MRRMSLTRTDPAALQSLRCERQLLCCSPGPAASAAAGRQRRQLAIRARRPPGCLRPLCGRSAAPAPTAKRPDTPANGSDAGRFRRSSATGGHRHRSADEAGTDDPPADNAAASPDETAPNAEAPAAPAPDVGSADSEQQAALSPPAVAGGSVADGARADPSSGTAFCRVRGRSCQQRRRRGSWRCSSTASRRT